MLEGFLNILQGLGGSGGFTPTAPTGGAPMAINQDGANFLASGAKPQGGLDPKQLQLLKGLAGGGMFQQPSSPGIIQTPPLMPVANPQPAMQPSLIGSISAPPYNPISPRLRRG